MGQTFREVLFLVAFDEVPLVIDHEHAHAETLDEVDQVGDHLQLETLLDQCILLRLDVIKGESASVRYAEDCSNDRISLLLAPQCVLYNTITSHFALNSFSSLVDKPSDEPDHDNCLR